MQRTYLTAAQGINTTYSAPGSSVAYYGPMGGPNLVEGVYTATTGNGAYNQSGFAAVYSRLQFVIGPTTAGVSTVLTSHINVGGTSPAAGNLTCHTPNPSVNNSSSSYYYDATDLDAITAGQGVGYMQTLTAASGTMLMVSIAVACDCLNQGFSSPFMYANQASQGAQYGNAKYSHIAGNSYPGCANSTQQPSQDYAAAAFVASYLQWQSCSGNTDADGTATIIFGSGATWGSATDSSLKAQISGAGFIGLMLDATDISAVPAGSYLNFHWSGAASNSSIRIGNLGIHVQGAGNNSTLLAAGGIASSWTTSATTWTTFNHVRFDATIDENQCAVPTAGVFSGLAVQIAAYASADGTVTFTLLNGPVTGDTGAGSGNVPTTSGGFNSTSVVASFPTSTTAPAWAFDATDIAAFTPQQVLMLQAVNSGGLTAPATKLQAQSINFTAPAHLGLLTQGAG